MSAKTRSAAAAAVAARPGGQDVARPPKRTRPQRQPVVRQFLMQGLANVIALILSLFTIALVVPSSARSLPGSLEHVISLLPALAVFAAILTVLQRLLHPLLVVAFGNLVLRSFGLFLLLIDMLVFTMTASLTPLGLTLGQQAWWGIPVITVVFNIFVVLLTTLFGLNRPRPDGTQAYEEFWRIIERLPSLRRNWLNERLRQPEVFGTLVEYVLEIVLADSFVGRLRRRCWRLIYRRPNPLDDLTAPQKARVMLQQLGPAYVKFGQMVSSQTRALPEPWIEELEKLQSNVPAVPYEAARDVIMSDLGQPPETLFAQFDPDATAAASTAQVHRAVLHDGTVVAVKVQRPNIVASVKADLGVLQDIVAVVENVSALARSLHLSAVLEEFAGGVIRELDYRNEAYHMVRMADDMTDLPLVRVPAVHRALSGTKVLTMGFVDGVPANRWRGADTAHAESQALTEAFVRAFVKQVFVDGFFHADPHPGNIFVDADGELVLLDLGLVGRLNPPRRFDLIELMMALQSGDSAALTDVALRVTQAAGEVDRVALRADLSEMIEQHVRYASEPTFESMTGALVPVLQAHGLSLAAPLTLALKAVAQAQEVVQLLGGRLDFVAFIVTEVKGLLLAEYRPEDVLDGIRREATRAGTQLVRAVTQDGEDVPLGWLGKGRFTVQVDTQDLNRQVESLNHTVGKFTAGLVLIGMIVGVALLVMQIPQLMILFVALLVFSTRLVYGLLRPKKKGV